MTNLIHEVERKRGITLIRNYDDGVWLVGYKSSDPVDYVSDGSYEAMNEVTDYLMRWFERKVRSV